MKYLPVATAALICALTIAVTAVADLTSFQNVVLLLLLAIYLSTADLTPATD